MQIQTLCALLWMRDGKYLNISGAMINQKKNLGKFSKCCLEKIKEIKTEFKENVYKYPILQWRNFQCVLWKLYWSHIFKHYTHKGQSHMFILAE